VRLLRLSAIWAALALGVGLFVLLGYFVDLGFIQNFRLTFLRWAVLLAAAALVVGLVNLLAVHWRKVSLTEEGWIYSGVLILSFTVTLVLALVFRPDGQAALFIFNTFQLPLESSLMAVLAVSLLVAGFRLELRRFTSPPPPDGLFVSGRLLLGHLRHHIAFEEGVLKQVEDTNATSAAEGAETGTAPRN